MSSPFTTIEEFNSAIDGPTEGAIYTFANSPIINGIALVVAAVVFIWFIIATYTTHAQPPAINNEINKSIDRLSSFIVIGLLSLVAADYRQSARPRPTARTAEFSSVEPNRQAPRSLAPLGMGLLGMVGIGWPSNDSARRAKARAKSRQEKRRKRIVRPAGGRHLR